MTRFRSTIVHVFDTVGIWGGIRFGLWIGAAVSCALWAFLFYDPVFYLGFEAQPTATPTGEEARR